MDVSKSVGKVWAACMGGARKAEIYLSPELVVRAARRHKPDKRNRTTEIDLTTGKPNYREREFIIKCKEGGESFPVKKMQLTWYNK